MESKIHSPSPLAGPISGDTVRSAAVDSSELQTLPAPSFAVPVAPAVHAPPAVGDCLGDFKLIGQLGKGGFATVFLAQQLSLGRKVALKVGPNRGTEAQTMARLEHDHIVHVFSETVDHDRQLRLLCMQFVAGTTLQDMLRAMPNEIRRNGKGSDLLKVLDEINPHSEDFRPLALRDREVLAASDFFQAVCWIGSRLANALEFAHQHGVLHRDIKPANILLNGYGRPLLADFNLATSCFLIQEATIGGTLPYMSPEQLLAFSSKKQEDLLDVDQRSDVYSLGVVLYEFATGQKPFTPEQLLDDVRPPIRPLTHLQPSVPEGLDQIVRIALASDPRERYQSAGELHDALENCRHHLRSVQQLPPAPWWTSPFHRKPFLAMLFLALIPNLIGSAVNIAYNFIHIVGELSPLQNAAFHWVVLLYNSVAYPVLVGITLFLLGRARRDWLRVASSAILPREFLVGMHRQLQRLASWSILGTSLGWFPGGLLFPIIIGYVAGSLSGETYIHFFISFLLSGLIAVTYCYLGTQYVVLRVLFPRLTGSPNFPKSELSPGCNNQVLRRLAIFQVSAGVIPLFGALLLILSGQSGTSDFWFRFLLAVLIILGMVGFTLALQISQYLSKIYRLIIPRESAIGV